MKLPMTVVSFIGRSFAFGIAALNLATTMHAVAAFVHGRPAGIRCGQFVDQADAVAVARRGLIRRPRGAAHAGGGTSLQVASPGRMELDGKEQNLRVM